MMTYIIQFICVAIASAIGTIVGIVYLSKKPNAALSGAAEKQDEAARNNPRPLE